MAEPLSAFYSTHLNSRIDSIEKLATRILRQLGCPIVGKLELAQEQCYEFIAMAVEHFSQYAGYTEEFLLFDSRLYRPGYGIKLDELFSTSTPELSARHDPNDPNTIVGYDYDLMDYRKVVDVANFEVGENTGTNILFSLQYALMQQMMGMVYSQTLNKGFHLIEWYNANEFLELRNKLLALKTYYRFDPYTQRLTLLPEPTSDGYGKYFALIRCYVERRFREMLNELWVQKYALALVKIALGHTRGKYGGTQLLGGGVIQYQDMTSQGIAERDKLEDQLLTGTGGWANMNPPAFIVQ